MIRQRCLQIARFLWKHVIALAAIASICLYLFHMQHSNIAGYPIYWAGKHLVNFVIDSPWHIEYVDYVAKTLELPAPSACWECHQPPLYYILASYPYAFADDSGLLSTILALRLLGLAFYLGFLYFAARLLALVTPSRGLRLLGFCLIAAWPSSVTKATMISNDVPLYTASAAALYYMMLWHKTHTFMALARAILWCGLAISFKYSGITLLPLFAWVVAIGIWHNRTRFRQLYSRPVILCSLVALALAGSSFYRTYHHYRIEKSSTASLIVPTATTMVKLMRVSNAKLEYFLLPDMDSFFTSPFLDPNFRGREQTYFFNFFLKSAIFGCTKWNNVALGWSIMVLSTLMLVFMAASSAWMIGARDRHFRELQPFVLFMIAQIVAVMGYRYFFPHTGNQDFRFVYHSVIAMAAMYLIILDWHRRHAPALCLLGAAMALMVTAASAALIIVNPAG